MTYQIPLPPPPRIVQEDHLCWAAAYESWTRACAGVIPGATPSTQASIQQRVGALNGTIDASGGTTPLGNMAISVVGQVQYEQMDYGHEMTLSLFRDRLTRFGYIYLIYYADSIQGNTFSHAIVVYGVTETTLTVMDPGARRGLIPQPIGPLQRRGHGGFLGTHKCAHPA